MSSLLAGLSLRAKIGQLLNVGFSRCHPQECNLAVRDIRDLGVGGVIFFDQEMANGTAGRRNVESPAQVKALLAHFQSHAKIPLLTSVDQEGGRVNRLKAVYGFPDSISHEELGRIDDPAETDVEQLADFRAQRKAGEQGGHGARKTPNGERGKTGVRKPLPKPECGNRRPDTGSDAGEFGRRIAPLFRRFPVSGFRVPVSQNSNVFVIVHLFGWGMRALAIWPLGWAVTARRSSSARRSRTLSWMLQRILSPKTRLP